jgi:hypothetical protein
LSATFRAVCGRRPWFVEALAAVAGAKGFAAAASVREGVATGWRPVRGWVQPGCHPAATAPKVLQPGGGRDARKVLQPGVLRR